MSKNSYGFDFLRNEHLDATAQQNRQQQQNASDVADAGRDAAIRVQDKSDLEKQYDVLAFLQAHRGSGCLAPNVIYRATGIDLDEESNAAVAEMLQRNPKVRTEMVPDPENPALMVGTYSYQAKYSNIRDRTTLLAQINRMTSGVSMRDLSDSYQTAEDDLRALITAGDVIAIANNEDKDKILFPRGEAFLVELDGVLTLPVSASNNGKQNGSLTNGHSGHNGVHDKFGPSASEVFLADTDVDPQPQIRRGEAVQVGGQWFRVSSAVRAGSLQDQPARAQAPLSVVSLQELSKRNLVDGYIRPMTAKCLPVDAPLSETSQSNLWAAKGGREKLARVAASVHAGRSSGAGGGAAALVNQLMGASAHAGNPTTIASQFASGAASAHRHHHNTVNQSSIASSNNQISGRKRPNPNTAKPAPTESSGDVAAAAKKFLSKDALEKVAGDPAMAMYGHARRHGCTTDVRDMYLATRSLVPEADSDLQAMLVKHKLLEPNEEMRRKRLAKQKNVDNDGKPKKRRYYTNKNQRMTNTHLEGTEIGAVLARAAERQKQGKSVGDGGM